MKSYARPLMLPQPLQPIGDDIADQAVVIHALAELIDDVIACLHLDAAQIRRRRCIGLGGDQPAKLDEVRHLRTFHDNVEDLAQAAAIAPTWRGGQADEWNAR